MGRRVFRSSGAAGVAMLLLLGAATSPATAQGVSTRSDSTTPRAEVITLGADTEILRDDLGAVGYWGTSGDDAAVIEYADGTLRFSTTTAPSPRWSWRELEVVTPVLWMRASVDLAVRGGAGGAMCGDAGTPPSFLFGIVNTEDEWVVGRAMGPDVSVIARGALPPSIDLTQGGRAIVSLECAVTGPSGGRVAVWVDGVNVADVTLTEAIGPFSRAGLYGEGWVDGFTVALDDVVAASGTAYAPLMRSPDGSLPVPPASAPPILPLPSASTGASLTPAGDVLDHVPAAISGSCTPTASDPANGLVAAVQCAPAGEIDRAAYFRYDGMAALEAAFAAVMADAGAVTQGTDCSVGPAMVEYTVGDRSAGRLACYLADGTAVALWTNTELLMMGIGAETSGDFGRLFTWWQDAGPLS